MRLLERKMNFPIHWAKFVVPIEATVLTAETKLMRLSLFSSCPTKPISVAVNLLGSEGRFGRSSASIMSGCI